VPGGIFISYRRQDASDVAGRLYDRLADRFGEDRVFMDVDTIELGVDFAEVITSAVGTCEVLLAVIGPGWATATDRDGRRRLDDPDDVVRLEVGAGAGPRRAGDPGPGQRRGDAAARGAAGGPGQAGAP
jgi:hypothetical protein